MVSLSKFGGTDGGYTLDTDIDLEGDVDNQNNIGTGAIIINSDSNLNIGANSVIAESASAIETSVDSSANIIIDAVRVSFSSYMIGYVSSDDDSTFKMDHDFGSIKNFGEIENKGYLDKATNMLVGTAIAINQKVSFSEIENNEIIKADGTTAILFGGDNTGMLENSGNIEANRHAIAIDLAGDFNGEIVNSGNIYTEYGNAIDIDGNIFDMTGKLLGGIENNGSIRSDASNSSTPQVFSSASAINIADGMDLFINNTEGAEIFTYSLEAAVNFAGSSSGYIKNNGSIINDYTGGAIKIIGSLSGDGYIENNGVISSFAEAIWVEEIDGAIMNGKQGHIESSASGNGATIYVNKFTGNNIQNNEIIDNKGAIVSSVDMVNNPAPDNKAAIIIENIDIDDAVINNEGFIVNENDGAAIDFSNLTNNSVIINNTGGIYASDSGNMVIKGGGAADILNWYDGDIQGVIDLGGNEGDTINIGDDMADRIATQGDIKGISDLNVMKGEFAILNNIELAAADDLDKNFVIEADAAAIISGAVTINAGDIDVDGLISLNSDADLTFEANTSSGLEIAASGMVGIVAMANSNGDNDYGKLSFDSSVRSTINFVSGSTIHIESEKLFGLIAGQLDSVIEAGFISVDGNTIDATNIGQIKVSDNLAEYDFELVANGQTAIDIKVTQVANNNIFGDDLNNTMQGSFGRDSIIGGDGDDTIKGELGNDVLLGKVDDDSISGGAGDDYIRGGAGADTIDGGDGFDIIDYFWESSEGIVLDLSAGTGSSGDADGDMISNVERVYGTGFDDDITASDSGDDIRGMDGDDMLFGGDGDDMLFGGDGDDDLEGGAGADTILGGDGVDSLNYSASDAFISINLKSGMGTGGDAQGDVISSIEDIIATNFGDTVRGGTADEKLDGLAGDDSIEGWEGDDTIEGRKGDDVLLGKTGDDIINGGIGSDYIRGGAGSDTLDGGRGFDKLDYYWETSEAIAINLKSGMGTSGDADGDIVSNFERVYGTRFDDNIIGSDDGEELLGMEGDDSLEGGMGDDFLEGREGADNIDGGDGIDVADYIRSDGGIRIDLAQNTASGGHATGDVLTDVENIHGSFHSDEIIGDSEDNLLIGNYGDDSLEGGSGDDRIYGGLGADYIVGGAGADVLDGGFGFDELSYHDSAIAGITLDLDAGTGQGGHAAGDRIMGFESIKATDFDDTISGGDDDEEIFGMDGDDSLSGADGDDLLVGGAGDDTIEGGDDSDYLTGGAGDDVFVFKNIDDSKITSFDLIEGFEDGDQINLDLESENISDFGDIAIADDGTDTSITAAGTDLLIKLRGVISLDNNDFIFGQLPSSTSPVPDFNLDDLEVDENEQGEVVGNLTFTSFIPGVNNTITVDDQRFEVVNNQLKLKNNVSLDFEQEETISINITIADFGGTDFTKPFEVVVIDDVNEVGQTISGDPVAIGQEVELGLMGVVELEVEL